jgi:hypothetical protein
MNKTNKISVTVVCFNFEALACPSGQVTTAIESLTLWRLLYSDSSEDNNYIIDRARSQMPASLVVPMVASRGSARVEYALEVQLWWISASIHAVH